MTTAGERETESLTKPKGKPTRKSRRARGVVPEAIAEPKAEVQKEPELVGIPNAVKRHVRAGCEYLGADPEGVFIVRNTEGYHRVAADGVQLDLLGDGLPDEYLKSLRK